MLWQSQKRNVGGLPSRDLEGSRTLGKTGLCGVQGLQAKFGWDLCILKLLLGTTLGESGQVSWPLSLHNQPNKGLLCHMLTI
jgi:hypothetical protein